MGEFNQSEYINTYIRETYDTFKIQVPKGQKEEIEKHRKEKGYKSLNAYVKDLINKDLEGGGVIYRYTCYRTKKFRPPYGGFGASLWMWYGDTL